MSIADDHKVELLKDDTYQLVKYNNRSYDPYERIVIHQGTLEEINAYVSLLEKGFEL